MCRYAMSGPYKRPFACFSCRKAFKQPPIEDYLAIQGRGYVYKQLRHLWSNEKILRYREEELGHRLTTLEAEYRDATHKCPECGAPMIDLGLDFKPPRQTDHKAWRILQGMYRAGHAFHTCGCDGPGWIPRSTHGYRTYLASRRKHYAAELELVQQSRDLTPEGKKEAAEYWTSRIESIDREQVT